MNSSTLAARQNLKDARLDDYVARVVAQAPKLTTEQRDTIMAAFAGFTPGADHE
jgi:hypothetical protein